MAQDTLEIVTGSSEVETMVKKRYPPRSLSAGCVQKPDGRGAVTSRTPSYDWLAEGYVESSEVRGLMNMGDSVNESAMEDALETLLKFKDTSPPTFQTCQRP